MVKMNITICPENAKDYFETEYITREAFWDVYHPGCMEHLVLHNLRLASGFVRELDLVACDGERIVGNVVCSKAKVINGKQEFEVLSMGPLAVLPEYQGKGIGSLLIKANGIAPVLYWMTGAVALLAYLPILALKKEQ